MEGHFEDLSGQPFIYDFTRPRSSAICVRLLSPLPKGFQFNSETQAIWRLVERKISPTPGVIRPKDDFGGAGFPFLTETFLDLGISSSEHGWVSHMTQDLAPISLNSEFGTADFAD